MIVNDAEEIKGISPDKIFSGKKKNPEMPVL